MHDFCFTIPYGLVLVGGGIVGYAKKGSLASLGGGLGTGFVLILAGYLSLKAFKKKKNSYLALILETGIVQFFWTVLEICTFVKFRFRYGVLLKFGGKKVRWVCLWLWFYWVTLEFCLLWSLGLVLSVGNTESMNISLVIDVVFFSKFWGKTEVGLCLVVILIRPLCNYVFLRVFFVVSCIGNRSLNLVVW